ncbi:HlyD family secretion protein [Rhodobacter sp. NSM]|uniref:HlyD family secretion protein n=1 Tax=Rhodobacter sp. NSM TaxID=3457501 RepID=UPI003FD3699B
MTLSETILGLFAAVFGGSEPAGWNGYAEADTIIVAPVDGGRILSIAADEGERVTAGQPLVVLESDGQRAALAAARAAVAMAEANLDNLRTGLRAEEIAVTEASLHRAEADLDLAQVTLERSALLLAQGRVPQATVDQDQATLKSAEAQVEQLRAELAVARLPAREAERVAAEAALRQAEAEGDRARVALEDRTLEAPIAGLVQVRYHDPGEVASAGAPILSLYDPERLHAIFFLPEADRIRIAPGARLSVTCTGCPETLTATVTTLATDPQYTPPILYSRDERARLVFRAEAEIAAGSGILPGQPLTVVPLR